MANMLPDKWYTIPDAFGFTSSEPLDLSYVDAYRQETLGQLNMNPPLKRILMIEETKRLDVESVGPNKFMYLRGLYGFPFYTKDSSFGHPEYLPEANFMGNTLRMYLGIREEHFDITLRRHVDYWNNMTSIHFASDEPRYSEVTDIVSRVYRTFPTHNEKEEIGRMPIILVARTGLYVPLTFLIQDVREEDIFDGYYRYELLLKSENGTFVSNAISYSMPRTGEFTGSRFELWRPEVAGRMSTDFGLLYVPLFSEKVAPLEIMLTEKGPYSSIRSPT